MLNISKYNNSVFFVVFCRNVTLNYVYSKVGCVLYSVCITLCLCKYFLVVFLFFFGATVQQSHLVESNSCCFKTFD